jgi:signal transduction histidine kinase
VRLGVCDGWAQARVQDYGTGVAEADRERIFQRYYQARRSSTTAQAGLGLGLYVAREIMLAHGGDLEFTASSAHGSIFSARLPLAR